MPNTIGTACDFKHLIHPLSMPKDKSAPGIWRRISGAALLILSIPFTLGILTGLYLYWAHKKVVQIKKEKTKAIDSTVQRLFGQQVGGGTPPKNSPFVQTAHSLYKGNTEKAFNQMKELSKTDQLTDEAKHALLNFAIEQNKIELIEPILDEFPDIKIPLHRAKSGEMVTLLIKRGAKPNKKVNNEGNTPLHFAANVEVAKALVAGGAKVKLNYNNYTPLHTCKDPKVAAYLVTPEPDGLGIDVNYTHANTIPTPIFTVPENVAIALIRDHQADPNIPHPNGENLLHSCAGPDLAKLILDNEVDINIRDIYGNPPLFTVQNEKVLKLLIEKGANVRAINDGGDTILHFRSLPESILDLVLAKAGKVEGPSLFEIGDENGSPPLFANPSDQMKLLFIKKGADPKIRDEDQHNALFFCKTKELGRVLIEKGVAVDGRDRDASTPLHYAKNVEMAAFLLENGADIDARGYGNLPPLLLNGHEAVRQLLIHRGADLTITDSKGRGPLHYAAREGDLETVRLLLEKKQNPNDVDANGNTPLSLLLKENSSLEIEIVELLAQQTDLNAVDKEQKSALHYLLPHDPDPDLIQTFLDKGALPNALDKEGNTPLFYCEDEDAAEVLVKHGADPKHVNHAGQTALFLASSDDFAEYLVDECKIDVAIKDKQGRSPLHTCQSPWAIKWMIEHGNLDPKATDNDGQTPLHIHCNRYGIVNVLMGRVDINAADNRGRTPLHLCRDPEIAGILIKAGAKSVPDNSGQLPEILDKSE